MAMDTIRNTLVYNLESSINSLEAMIVTPEKYPPLHPGHNPRRMQQLHDQLESIRAEFQMISWDKLFSVPERMIVITVPDQVNGVHARMALLERYLCNNSKLDACIALDPATMQPEKLYAMEVDRSKVTTHNTFFINHKNHEPRLSVVSDWVYEQVPPRSDRYQTIITYYCAFIDEEPIIDTIVDTIDTEPTPNEVESVATDIPTVPAMSKIEMRAMLSQNMSRTDEEGPFK